MAQNSYNQNVLCSSEALQYYNYSHGPSFGLIRPATRDTNPHTFPLRPVTTEQRTSGVAVLRIRTSAFMHKLDLSPLDRVAHTALRVLYGLQRNVAAVSKHAG